MREDNTKNINTLDDLKAMFASEEEISGGFAMCHFVDEPEVNDQLKAMKLSVRCIPIDQPEEPGKCIFTGKETLCRGVIAKAY
jgi:prolyl-tRNA synthetase